MALKKRPQLYMLPISVDRHEEERKLKPGQFGVISKKPEVSSCWRFDIVACQVQSKMNWKSILSKVSPQKWLLVQHHFICFSFPQFLRHCDETQRKLKPVKFRVASKKPGLGRHVLKRQQLEHGLIVIIPLLCVFDIFSHVPDAEI